MYVYIDTKDKERRASTKEEQKKQAVHTNFKNKQDICIVLGASNMNKISPYTFNSYLPHLYHKENILVFCRNSTLQKIMNLFPFFPQKKKKKKQEEESTSFMGKTLINSNSFHFTYEEFLFSSSLFGKKKKFVLQERSINQPAQLQQHRHRHNTASERNETERVEYIDCI